MDADGNGHGERRGSPQRHDGTTNGNGRSPRIPRIAQMRMGRAATGRRRPAASAVWGAVLPHGRAFAVGRPPQAVRRSPSAVRRRSLAARRSPFAMGRSPSLVGRTPFAVRRSLITHHSSLITHHSPAAWRAPLRRERPCAVPSTLGVRCSVFGLAVFRARTAPLTGESAKKALDTTCPNAYLPVGRYAVVLTAAKWETPAGSSPHREMSAQR